MGHGWKAVSLQPRSGGSAVCDVSLCPPGGGLQNESLAALNAHRCQNETVMYSPSRCPGSPASVFVVQSSGAQQAQL